SLGPTTAIQNLPEPRPEFLQDECRELIQCIRRKQIAVGAGNLLQLLRNGSVDLSIAVTDAKRGRAARAVEIFASRRIEQIAALATHQPRQILQTKPNSASHNRSNVRASCLPPQYLLKACRNTALSVLAAANKVIQD